MLQWDTGRVFRTVCDRAYQMHCMISKHNGWFLELTEKRNVKQNRQFPCLFWKKKKKITEINLFVAWHYHGQIMCLYLLFIVTDPHKICGCPLEKESWRASAIHFSSLELTCFLTEHSHFKCSLIKILLLISSLKTEPELIWHVFEGGKLGKKASVFSVNSRNGTN